MYLYQGDRQLKTSDISIQSYMQLDLNSTLKVYGNQLSIMEAQQRMSAFDVY